MSYVNKLYSKTAGNSVSFLTSLWVSVFPSSFNSVSVEYFQSQKAVGIRWWAGTACLWPWLLTALRKGPWWRLAVRPHCCWAPDLSLVGVVKKVRAGRPLGAVVLKSHCSLFFSSWFPSGLCSSSSCLLPQHVPWSESYLPSRYASPHVLGGKSVLLMWLWENVKGMNFKKSGYRIGIWGLYWFLGS